MNEEKKKLVQEMLYDKSADDVLKNIENINDVEILYVFAYNYNWDNGFKIPEKIISKECCDLSLALMIFYKSDGIRYLLDKSLKNDALSNWLNFIEKQKENQEDLKCLDPNKNDG